MNNKFRAEVIEVSSDGTIETTWVKIKGAKFKNTRTGMFQDEVVSKIYLPAEKARELGSMLYETVEVHLHINAVGQCVSKLPTRISDLDLNVRACNALNRTGITTIKELVSFSEQELLKFDGFGRIALKDIKKELAIHGFELKKNDSCSNNLPNKTLKKNDLLKEPTRVKDLDIKDDIIEQLFEEGIFTIRCLVAHTEYELLEHSDIQLCAISNIKTALSKVGLNFKKVVPVSDLNITSESVIILTGAGITTINDLITYTEQSLLKEGDINDKVLKDVIDALAKRNLSLRKPFNEPDIILEDVK